MLFSNITAWNVLKFHNYLKSLNFYSVFIITFLHFQVNFAEQIPKTLPCLNHTYYTQESEYCVRLLYLLNARYIQSNEKQEKLKALRSFYWLMVLFQQGFEKHISFMSAYLEHLEKCQQKLTRWILSSSYSYLCNILFSIWCQKSHLFEWKEASVNAGLCSTTGFFCGFLFLS